jgi:HlyD family secretion protein
MDQQIKSKSNWKKTLGFLIVVIALGSLGWLVYAAGSNRSFKVNVSQIEIATAEQSSFKEGLMISGNIIPDQQNFLDASESGTVEKIYAKSGDELKKGDTIVQLSNSNLRLEVLQRESQLLEQLNTQRQTRILLNQNDLSQKQQIEEVNYELDIQKRRYERNQKLHNKGVIADQQFEEIKKRYQYLQKRQIILQKVYRTDSLARATQLQQIDRSEDRLEQNLIAVQNILDKLCIKAPMDGKLSDFELSNGERVSEGQRIGVVYDINPPKIEAQIDELYINQLNTGLSGDVQINNETYKVSLIEKFPNVEEGNFRVILSFMDPPQTEIYNGQSLRIKLNLSAPKNALVIPKGRFYANTGGEWIFVVNGDIAEKREIKIGQQNAEYYEITRGLKVGDEVIISTYDNFQDYNQLKLNQS